jgi:uncharacterized protein with von Willebrand factor type A (vWA) domain
MTYAFASLPENLAAFCAVLRRDHRFRIGPRELLDAAHGLEIADIGDEHVVRDVLRPILSKTHDDVTAFDAAFTRFFHGRAGPLPAYVGRPEPSAPSGADGVPGETKPAADATDGADLERGTGAGEAHAIEGAEEEAAATLLRASYSPLDARGEPLVLEPPTRAWLEAAAAAAASVQAAASRRWRPALRGPRFDFRRTLRTSLHTGGEPLTPRWRAHPRRHSRFVLLVDGSRSMNVSAEPALHASVALSALSSRTETFVFSTKLKRVTRDVRRAAAGERRTLHVREAWGGGTTIGACLHEFLLRFGERLLGPDTVILIASDGLDVGSPELLRQSMARLARSAAAIVWINPLLETRGYEPTAVGMSLARPYVTVLVSVRDPEGLRSLARTLRGV